ncbi:Hypothetical_protein [Hexamita inflata]|uniref:Hypothetical_protein n=1 Tax=Hexamita inflata TaxID=28002 RepID=A0AA86V430_9EUKA|nr:Hypothetical protein HINF_LOCUS63122 [Hexamita inflata]
MREDPYTMVLEFDELEHNFYINKIIVFEFAENLYQLVNLLHQNKYKITKQDQSPNLSFKDLRQNKFSPIKTVPVNNIRKIDFTEMQDFQSEQIQTQDVQFKSTDSIHRNNSPNQMNKYVGWKVSPKLQNTQQLKQHQFVPQLTDKQSKLNESQNSKQMFGIYSFATVQDNTTQFSKINNIDVNIPLKQEVIFKPVKTTGQQIEVMRNSVRSESLIKSPIAQQIPRKAAENDDSTPDSPEYNSGIHQELSKSMNQFLKSQGETVKKTSEKPSQQNPIKPNIQVGYNLKRAPAIYKDSVLQQTVTKTIVVQQPQLQQQQAPNVHIPVPVHQELVYILNNENEAQYALNQLPLQQSQKIQQDSDESSEEERQAFQNSKILFNDKLKQTTRKHIAQKLIDDYQNSGIRSVELRSTVSKPVQTTLTSRNVDEEQTVNLDQSSEVQLYSMKPEKQSELQKLAIQTGLLTQEPVEEPIIQIHPFSSKPVEQPVLEPSAPTQSNFNLQNSPAEIQEPEPSKSKSKKKHSAPSTPELYPDITHTTPQLNRNFTPVLLFDVFYPISVVTPFTFQAQKKTYLMNLNNELVSKKQIWTVSKILFNQDGIILKTDKEDKEIIGNEISPLFAANCKFAREGWVQ